MARGAGLTRPSTAPSSSARRTRRSVRPGSAGKPGAGATGAAERRLGGQAARTPFDTPWSGRRRSSGKAGKEEIVDPQIMEQRESAVTKLLATIERRNDEAFQRVLTARERKVEQAERTDAADVVDAAKQAGKRKLRELDQSISIAQLREQHAEELEQLQTRYTEEKMVLRRERDELSYQLQRRNKAYDDVQAQADSMRHVVHVLRRKLQNMTEREVSHHHKLKVFRQMEPIFQQLAETFDFSSPSEVLERLESLERAQVESYTQLLDAQEQRNKAERQMATSVRAKESQVQGRLMALQQQLAKSDEMREAQAERIERLETDLAKSTEAYDQYLSLSFTIIDLWNTFAASEIVSEETSKVDLPDMANPMQVIDTIRQLVVLHSPTQAARFLQRMTGRLNTLWRKYLAHDGSLKGKPLDILTAIDDQMHQRTATISRLQRLLDEAKKCRKIDQDEMRKLQVTSRMLQASLEKKITGGRPPAAPQLPARYVEQARAWARQVHRPASAPATHAMMGLVMAEPAAVPVPRPASAAAARSIRRSRPNSAATAAAGKAGLRKGTSRPASAAAGAVRRQRASSAGGDTTGPGDRPTSTVAAADAAAKQNKEPGALEGDQSRDARPLDSADEATRVMLEQERQRQIKEDAEYQEILAMARVFAVSSSPFI